MTHDAAWELALRALESPLAVHEQHLLDTHTKACAACREQFRSLQVVHDALRQSPSLPNAATVARTRKRTWGRLLNVAAVVLVGLGAYGLGAYRSGRPPSLRGQHRYVLMLEEPQASWPPATMNRPGYGQWAAALSEEERLTKDGIQLALDDGWYVDGSGRAVSAAEAPTRRVNYSGFFVVTADNYEEALRIARASPHLGWGGILVRQASRPPQR